MRNFIVIFLISLVSLPSLAKMQSLESEIRGAVVTVSPIQVKAADGSVCLLSSGEITFFVRSIPWKWEEVFQQGHRQCILSRFYKNVLRLKGETLWYRGGPWEKIFSPGLDTPYRYGSKFNDYNANPKTAIYTIPGVDISQDYNFRVTMIQAELINKSEGMGITNKPGMNTFNTKITHHSANIETHLTIDVLSPSNEQILGKINIQFLSSTFGVSESQD